MSREELIVRGVAKRNPIIMGAQPWEKVCEWCGVSQKPNRRQRHKPDCIWRLANELLEEGRYE